MCLCLTEFVSSENSLAQNVSEGQTAEFTCVTTNSHAIITWTTTPNVGPVTPINSNQPSGGRRSVLRFNTLAKNNHTIVRCIITDTQTYTSTTHQGELLVQGKYMYCQGRIQDEGKEGAEDAARKARRENFANY